MRVTMRSRKENLNEERKEFIGWHVAPEPVRPWASRPGGYLREVPRGWICVRNEIQLNSVKSSMRNSG
jgi:hypothetical protein